MRSLFVEERDGSFSAELREAPAPVPGPGEVLIRVAASGLNRADLHQIAGSYPPPPGESEILGLEVSGVAEATGEKVCALLAGGGHAEFVSAPAGQVFPLPNGVELAGGAAIPEAFLTAFLNLSLEASLKAGDSVLIHAGASGVGLAAIQTAKFLGARVAATTRSASKRPALRAAGAELAIDAGAGPFSEPIEAAWGRNTVDIVLDPVGAETLDGNLRLLSSGGRVVFLATMSGPKSDLDIALLMKKRGRLIGSTLRARPREEKARIVARFKEEILPGFESGRLSVSIDAIYPPERAAEAFTRMRDNRNTGKVLIKWEP